MFQKTVATIALTLLVMIGGGARATAQEAKVTSAKDTENDQQVNAYRLDFAINESQDGKKINTRQYSMDLNSAEGGASELKIGTRVPVELKQGSTSTWERTFPVGFKSTKTNRWALPCARRSATSPTRTRPRDTPPGLSSDNSGSKAALPGHWPCWESRW